MVAARRARILKVGVMAVFQQFTTALKNRLGSRLAGEFRRLF